MSTYCGICRKSLGNEPKFPMESGGVMCEDCWLEFQKGEKDDKNENGFDDRILDIIKHKEQYRSDKLKETSQWFRDNGYTNEAEEIEIYLKNSESDKNETSTIIHINGREYEGSKTNVWSNFMKTICYIFCGISTILFGVIGGGLFYGNNLVVLGVLLGALVGFILGFVSIAVVMLFVTMSENISILTNNSAKILAKLDEINNK